MARPLRFEYPNAHYHVMNRGNRGMAIFSDAEEHGLFLKKLGEFSEAYRVDVMCYCLMVNHFHLYLRTPEGNLSSFMQALGVGYTISANRRRRERGHFFQGRFKAILVEDELYGAEVARYIHLNPARVQSLLNADIEIRRCTAREFPWSSYGAMIGLRRKPAWLKAENVLKRWGKTDGERKTNYASYVESGLLESETDPFEAAAAGSVLGSDSFVDKMRKAFVDIVENKERRRSLGAHDRLARWVSFDKLLETVCTAYGVDKSHALASWSRNNEARRVLIHLACRHCRGRYTLRELADLCRMTTGALTRASTIMRSRISADRKLAGRVAKIEKSIREADCK